MSVADRDALARLAARHPLGATLRGMEIVAAMTVRRARAEGAEVAAFCPPADDALPDPIARRIAARALAGAVSEPTRGATRAHALGDLPDWAFGRAPVAEWSGWMFYAVD